MQCHGKTRNGRRCRNRSLDNELFCDIHMRVNYSHNLTLLLPALLGLLAGYFFFFGLFFETAIFGIFDINYLKYAGIEDLLLTMLRFGGMVLLILLGIWMLYAVLLFLLCCLWLIVRMIKATAKHNMTLAARLKTIALSLAVFWCNILLLLVIIFPNRYRKQPKKLTLRREMFANSLAQIRKDAGGPIKGQPFINANDVLQNFISFKRLGNHRFFMVILALLSVSLGVTYYAGSKAEYARACAIAQHTKPSLLQKGIFPAPTFILERPCQSSGPEGAVRYKSLTAKFGTAIADFFDIESITLQTKQGPLSLLHLATTSRFDLFFSGKTGRSLALPRGSLTFQAADSKDADTSLPVANLQTQFDRMKDTLSASNRTLFGLGNDLKDTNKKLTRLNIKRNQSAQRSIPLVATCWNKPPQIVITYPLGSYVITDANMLDRLIQLSRDLKSNTDQSLVLFGFADPSGPLDFNNRLSWKRAFHVLDIFEKLGNDREDLVAIGLGENTDTHLAQRRVEIRLCNLTHTF